MILRIFYPNFAGVGCRRGFPLLHTHKLYRHLHYFTACLTVYSKYKKKWMCVHACLSINQHYFIFFAHTWHIWFKFSEENYRVRLPITIHRVYNCYKHIRILYATAKINHNYKNKLPKKSITSFITNNKFTILKTGVTLHHLNY